jgi:hypothetical protein
MPSRNLREDDREQSGIARRELFDRASAEGAEKLFSGDLPRARRENGGTAPRPARGKEAALGARGAVGP